MVDICGDNRFELIEKYKKKLIEATNIETSPEEMNVLDDILLRFWQMGWLDKLEHSEPQWIPCSKGLPKCEKEVLICTKKKSYINRKSGMEWYEKSVITPAMYEDGTMLEVNSKWHWEDIDYAGWDEEEDCGIIPEGWWENRHFNPDGVYNNLVDKEVVAWMPLPAEYREEENHDK